MKQCIENPNDVDWTGFWAEKLANKIDKDWDKAAPGFFKRTHKEDYNDALLSKLILDENDTVLDVGCGEGSVTIPIAKRVKKVIGIDSSPKMIEYLEKRAANSKLNDKYIKTQKKLKQKREKAAKKMMRTNDPWAIGYSTLMIMSGE